MGVIYTTSLGKYDVVHPSTQAPLSTVQCSFFEHLTLRAELSKIVFAVQRGGMSLYCLPREA